MKVFFSPYTLRPIQPLNALSTSVNERKGALLKVVWEDELTGYADLHPWVELGDRTLDEQLAALRAGRISSQIERCIWLARRDAELRFEGKSIFDQNKYLVNLDYSLDPAASAKMKNNFLLTDFKLIKEGFFDDLRAQDFSTVKIKVGKNLEQEADVLEHAAAAGFRIRLDFNSVANPKIFEKFIGNLSSPIRSLIEYVEDPFPFDVASWSEAQSLVRIAIDNEYEKVDWEEISSVPFDVIVIKPAKLDVNLAISRCQQWNLKATVTSYMDHAVGVSHALGVAMELKEKYGDMILESGCFTHHLYQPNSFSEEISTQGPYLMNVNGTGVGFNKLLEATPWFQLVEIQ